MMFAGHPEFILCEVSYVVKVPMARRGSSEATTHMCTRDDVCSLTFACIGLRGASSFVDSTSASHTLAFGCTLSLCWCFDVRTNVGLTGR